MKPLISYYGGKQRIASRIIDVLPPHTVYAEPFTGGAAVFFAKGRPHVTNAQNYREALNDTNEALVTMYRVAQTRPEEFTALINATPYSKADYARAWEILKSAGNGNRPDDLQIAWAMYTQAMMSFSNKLGAGLKRSVVGPTHAYTWYNRKFILPEIIAYLEGVYLDCVDALHFIELWDSPQTCFYVDPPYPGADQGHYSGYTQADFEALVDKLASCESSFVLSNYDNPAVPTKWSRLDIEVVMSAAHARDRANSSNERTEILWIVDRSANAADELKPHLWTPGRGFPYRQRTLFDLMEVATNGNGHYEEMMVV